MVLRETKNKVDRIAFIDVSTQQWLAHYLVQSRPLLAHPGNKALIVMDNGKRMLASRMQSIVAKYMDASKINKHISPHSFRRTLCSLLLKSGLNLKVIASIVGHLKLSTTAVGQPIDSSKPLVMKYTGVKGSKEKVAKTD